MPPSTVELFSRSENLYSWPVRKPWRAMSHYCAHRHVITTALLVLLACGLGCEKDERQLVPRGSTFPDVGPSPDIERFPAEDICEEGLVRCLATRSSEIQRCQVPEGSEVQVTRWVTTTCGEDEVCIESECVPFECSAGRSVCTGLNTKAVCNEAGDGVVGEAEACPDGTDCLGGSCVDPCGSPPASYLGCEYMVVELPNPYVVTSSQGAPFGLVVANPNKARSVTLSYWEGGAPVNLISRSVVRSMLTDDEDVEVGSVVQDRTGEVVETLSSGASVTIPPEGTATLLTPARPLQAHASQITNEARFLQATRPVIAYQFNPYCCNFSFTNDASLLLPTHALGTNYIHAGSPNWKPGQSDEVFSAGLTMGAVSHDTRVWVDGPSTTRLRSPIDMGDTLPIEATLQAGDVLHLSAAGEDGDLSGVVVTADKPIAAFSTHTCTQIPHGFVACDHLEQQLIPTATWGTEYILPTTQRRSGSVLEKAYWQLQTPATEGAVVTINGSNLDAVAGPFADGPACRSSIVDLQPGQLTLQLRAGARCMLSHQRPLYIESDAPLMVMGYIAGEEVASTGDPAMFLVPPIRQFRREYAFATPQTYKQDFVSIMIARSGVGKLTLDDLPIDPDSDLIYTVRANSDYVVLHVPVADGAHRISGDTPFGILVYAYDDFVSYAYTGGLNLDIVKR